jgi:hypothetical protein
MSQIFLRATNEIYLYKQSKYVKENAAARKSKQNEMY